VIEQGRGQLDLAALAQRPTPKAVQNHGWSTGAGPIEGARGTTHLVDEGIELRGEVDIFGQPLVSSEMAASRDAGTIWNLGAWFGRELIGGSWVTTSWGGTAWEARGWSARGWSGRGWSARGWSARGWSARGWSGRGWSAGSWGDPALPQTWTSALWSSAGWK
jgi:serine protease AprX